jgi:hypothetical protein
MRSSYITPKLREGETVDLSLYSPRERTNIRLYGLDFKDHTPQMIFEYKRKWATECETVTIRGKLDKATRWCKTNLFHQDFTVIKYANPDDSHSIHFKNPEEAMLFRLSH